VKIQNFYDDVPLTSPNIWVKIAIIKKKTMAATRLP